MASEKYYPMRIDWWRVVLYILIVGLLAYLWVIS